MQIFNTSCAVRLEYKHSFIIYSKLWFAFTTVFNEKRKLNLINDRIIMKFVYCESNCNFYNIPLVLFD